MKLSQPEGITGWNLRSPPWSRNPPNPFTMACQVPPQAARWMPSLTLPERSSRSTSADCTKYSTPFWASPSSVAITDCTEADRDESPVVIGSKYSNTRRFSSCENQSPSRNVAITTSACLITWWR